MKNDAADPYDLLFCGGRTSEGEQLLLEKQADSINN